MSDDQAPQSTETLAFLNGSESEGCALPIRWEDDPEEPGRSIDRLLTDWPKQEAYYTSQGAKCHRVVTDSSGITRFQPRKWVSFQAAAFENIKDEVNHEYITLSRQVVDGERKKPHPKSTILHQMSGDVRQELEMVTVTQEEVAALEAEGWEVWYPPPPALDPYKGYQDTRPKIPRPVDVVTTDKPAADTARYLARGNEIMSSVWTKGKWKPGDLIGKVGSDPEVKAQSATYATPDKWDEISDQRLATSAGHIMQIERPPNVCLGWGGYDKFIQWQAAGRRITKDMVEKEDWSADLNKPIEFVDEEGNVVRTITTKIKEHLLPHRPQVPVSLYEHLNARDARKLKGRPEPTTAKPEASDKKE
jgi:hypothetical protein